MNQQIRQQIRAARPTPAGPVPSELKRSIMASVLADQPTNQAPRERRRRWATPTIPVVLLAVLGVAGVATAATLAVSAATKQTAHDLRHSPPGNPGGPGVRGTALTRELQRLRAQTPYPPGVVDTFPVRHLQGVAIGSVQAVVEERANCYWQRYWVQSAESHNAQGQADALKILYQTIYWPAYNAPNQGNSRVIALRIAHQAATGDLTGFKAHMAINCQAVFTTNTSR